MNNIESAVCAEGEYWIFAAECNKPIGDVSRDECILTPEICLECEHCILTYVPDAMVFIPDKGGENSDVQGN